MTKWWTVAPAACALACGGPESAAHTESAPFRTAAGEILRESLTPLTPTRIDTLRDAEGEFYSPQYTTLALTRAGNVVALDNDDKQLILFDTTGRQRYSVGRNGGGPGEFRFLIGVIVLPGDSIAVWDPGLRRMSVFDANLKFHHTEQFPRWDLSGESALVGRLADGRWIARIVAHGPFTNPALGARISVDTARLMVGRSDEEPSEFHQLRLRSGVTVATKVGKEDFNIYKLLLHELNLGVGTVCEYGAVLVDSGGVRMLDAQGRIVRARALPRVGDSIRTPAERSDIVNSQIYEPVKSGPVAGETRTLLAKLVEPWKVRVLRPMLDVHGHLWYYRRPDPRVAAIVVDRPDSAGRAEAALAFRAFGPGVQFGSNSVAMMQGGSDTTGMFVTLTHFPKSIGGMDSRLGRCAPSFEY